jgi:hypothetical protein
MDDEGPPLGSRKSRSSGILLEQEAGATAADVCRKHGTSGGTFYTWNAKYGGMDFLGDALSERQLPYPRDRRRHSRECLFLGGRCLALEPAGACQPDATAAQRGRPLLCISDNATESEFAGSLTSFFIYAALPVATLQVRDP